MPFFLLALELNSCNIWPYKFGICHQLLPLGPKPSSCYLRPQEPGFCYQLLPLGPGTKQLLPAVTLGPGTGQLLPNVTFGPRNHAAVAIFYFLSLEPDSCHLPFPFGPGTRQMLPSVTF